MATTVSAVSEVSTSAGAGPCAGLSQVMTKLRLRPAGAADGVLADSVWEVGQAVERTPVPDTRHLIPLGETVDDVQRQRSSSGLILGPAQGQVPGRRVVAAH